NFLVQSSFAWLYAVRDPVVDEEVNFSMAIVKIGGASQVGGRAGNQFKGSIEALVSFFAQNNVDDPGHTFRFISCRRIGDDLDTFDHACLQLLQSASAFEAYQP